MSAESAGGIALLKWLWAAVFIPVLGWLFKRQDNMDKEIQRRYTKDETDAQITLRVAPLQKSIDKNTEVQEKLNESITGLRIQLAKLNKDIE